MNWKAIVIGGLVFFIVSFLIGSVTGMVIHDGVLKPTYKAHSEFWRPELNADPPDMASLMPRWITAGLISSLVLAALYCWLRGSFIGPPWLRGLKFGLVLWTFFSLAFLGWSGMFNLPDSIWLWWSLDTLLVYVPAGAVLGWVAAKFGC